MANYSTKFCLKIDRVLDSGKLWAEAQGVPVLIEHRGDAWVIFLDSDMVDGDVDAAMDWIQAYLRENEPNRVIGLEWAYVCSRLLPGAFGGGAAVITAVSIETMCTTSMVAERVEAAKLALDNKV